MLPTLGGISEDTNTLQTSVYIILHWSADVKDFLCPLGYNLGTPACERYGQNEKRIKRYA